MIVLDASVVIDLVLGTSAAEAVLERLKDHRQELIAPYIVDVEVLQALRRQVRLGKVPEDRASVALSNLQMLRFTRMPHEPLIARIWELRHNMTAYDAAYVALAETMHAELLTRDRKFSGAAGHTAKIVFL